jgi:iron complex transport system substrate-binding protein
VRVVSLCPSITETLVAIGGRRHLVAATRFCVRPRELLWGLPRIGGTKNPDVARILDLKPDLVFANEEENRLEDVRALQAAGIDVDVSFPRRVADVPQDVRRWGARIAADAQAEEIAGRIEREVYELTDRSAVPGFRYAYWIWKDPWMTVSDDTYVADLLRLAGGENVFGLEPVRYPRTSPAEAVARKTAVHLFADEPFPFRREKHDELLASLFPDESRRLYVSGDDYCWHGVRTLEGLKAVKKLMEELKDL